MRKASVLIALVVLVFALGVASVAGAATVPADGAKVSAIPVHLSTTDLVGNAVKASFYVDGRLLGSVRPTAVYTYDDEGHAILSGYTASLDYGVADGLAHLYEIKQGTIVRYSGHFDVDADPIIVDHWYEGVGNATGREYFKIVNNGTNTVTNAYHFDLSGSGGALTTLAGYPTLANGVYTYVRYLPHSAATADMLQMLYGGEIHGCAIKSTDGYSYSGDNMDITFTPYADLEVCCPHWGDNDPETIADHEANCWHAVLEQAAGVYGP